MVAALRPCPIQGDQDGDLNLQGRHLGPGLFSYEAVFALAAFKVQRIPMVDPAFSIVTPVSFISARLIALREHVGGSINYGATTIRGVQLFRDNRGILAGAYRSLQG